MRRSCVRRDVLKSNLSHSARLLSLLFRFTILWGALLPIPVTAAPVIRISGPDTAATSTEVILRAEALNESAKEILESGGFFEWRIEGTPYATGTVLRCRSSDPATYTVELRLGQRVGGRTVTFATDRRTLSFQMSPPSPSATPRTPEPAEAPLPSTPSARWVLQAQTTRAETNRVIGFTQRLEVRENESVAVSVQPGVGTVEARVRWPTLPSTLTPGNQLVFDLQQELRLSPTEERAATTPLEASLQAIFFAMSEYKHQRTVDSLSGAATNVPQRVTKIKRVQWLIPTGRLGDRLVLELGGQSSAGTASRLFTYVLESSQTTQPLSVAGWQVSLVAERMNIPVGAATTVRAQVKGAIPPLRFHWSVDGLAQTETGETLTVTLTRPGPARVACRISDASGREMRSELVLTGIAPAIRLLKDAPPGNSVFVGEPLVLRAELVGSTALASDRIAFRWTGSDAIFFDAQETTHPTNRARCYVVGVATVHVELIYRPAPAVVEFVGRSDPLALTVSPPHVLLVFDPPNPMVGQEVLLTVRTDPPMSGFECRWSEMPTNLLLLGRSSDSREIRFALKNSDPAPFKAALTLPRLGTIMAEGAGRIAAQRYTVVVAGPKGGEPKPVVWREGAGAITVEDAFAQRQPLMFSAELIPTAAVARWVWSATPKTCRIQTELGANASVVCLETGRYEIVARAYDAQGLELGAARKGFTVSISTQDIAAAQLRAEAQTMREKGYALLQAGQLREAVAAYRESYARWPTEELKRHIEQLERQLSQKSSAAEQAEALRREEEKRKAEAEQLKQAAWEHIRARRYDEGLEAFRRSLALKPDAELEAQVHQIRDAVEKRRARQTEAARWKKQGEALEAAGRLKEALAAYRSSLQAWTDEALEARMAQLEQKVAQQEAAAAKAAGLVAEGERLEQQGDWTAALAAYRESLKLRSSTDVAARVARLEERQRQQEADRQTAERLRNEAEGLLQKGAVEDALLKFRESLRLWPDDNVAEKARQAEARLEQERQARRRAAELREEAAAKALDGQLEEALAKYRESVALRPDAELDQRIRDLEAQIARQKSLRAEAARLADQAARLESEGKLGEALAAYKQSLEKHAQPDIAASIARLEERLRQQASQRAAAQKMAAQADALVAKGALDEGLLKYRESLRLWPDDAVAEKARAVEKRLAQQAKAREQAVRLKEEAAQYVLAGQLEAAVAKYRESAALRSDPELEKRIQQLEAEIEQKREARKQAEQWAADGARLEAEQKWQDALEAYRKSAALFPHDEVTESIRALEARLLDENQKRLQAAALREQAAAAVVSGKLEKGIELYRESLSLERNEMAEQQIAALEKQLQAKKTAVERAAQFYQDGLALEQQEKWEEAAGKYNECLVLTDHADARRRLSFVRRQIAEENRKKEKAAEAARVKEATARKLRDEGYALQQKGQPAEAAARFRASLDLIPDPELERLLKELEKTVAETAEKNAQADALREQARKEALMGHYEEAIRIYEQCLALRPDPAVEDALARARKEWKKRQDDLARAQELRQQAEALEKEEKWAEAAALLRQSLSYASDPEVRAQTARLEARAREQIIHQQAQAAAQEARKKSAMRLREDAQYLENQGRLEEALLKLRASLEIWDDPELREHVVALEKKRAEQSAIEQKAKTLEAEAAKLEQEGRLDEALAQYRACLDIQSNVVIQQHIAVLEQKVQEERHKRDEAARLASEGEQHFNTSRYDDAIAAFKASLALYHNAAVQEKLAAAEKQREQEARRRTEAMRLRDEAGTLLQQEKLDEALTKYRQSMDIWPDKKLEKQIAQLAERLEKQNKDRELARRLRDEAEQLERADRKDEALAKYRQSLTLESDPTVQNVVAKLQGEIERERAASENADRLWQEGMRQFRAGKKAEGLVLLRQSLSVRADPSRAEVVKQLESLPSLAIPQPAATAGPSPMAATVPPRAAAAPASSVRTQAVVAAAAPVVAPIPKRSDMSESRWKGVVLFNAEDESHQWPLHIRIGLGNNISGTFEERDGRTGRIVQYSVSGVMDPMKKVWYMACLRSEGQITQKATLSGKFLSEDVAGGSVSVLLGGVSGREPIKGIWRLQRTP